MKIKADEYIEAGLSNFKIIEALQKEGYEEMPDNRQLTLRRYYLKELILANLKGNKESGFYQ